MPKISNNGETPLQQFIRLELVRRGITRYWLSKACGWPKSISHDRLRRATLHQNVEKMLAALGTTIKCGRHRLKLSLNPDLTVRAEVAGE
jgi:hypothetical protein